jgi:lipoprotein-anchoring transpeptidase ErfK/SrfK
MALASGGDVVRAYAISSGKPSTPTIRGSFRFYRRQPGYNSLRMYYTVYFHGGYAIHGYSSVPNYPASHGCLREFIADARTVYNWVRLGDRIYVYG